MNTKKKPTIDPDKIGANPFMFNKQNKIKVKTYRQGQKIIVESVDGMLIPSGTTSSVYALEQQPFTKVFHDPDFREMLMLLSPNALKLIIFIMYKLERNQDYVWVNSRLFQAEAMIKHKADYITAAEELNRYQIITPTMYTDTYWINPFLLFFGNRIKKYPDHLLIKEFEE